MTLALGNRCGERKCFVKISNEHGMIFDPSSVLMTISLNGTSGSVQFKTAVNEVQVLFKLKIYIYTYVF